MKDCRIFVALFLLVIFPSYAQPYYIPVTATVYGEWLYVMPSIDQPNYAIEATNPTGSFPLIGERKANEQPWSSGYRLGVLMSSCDEVANFGLRWTHFPTFSWEEKIQGDSLWATLNPAGNTASDETRISDQGEIAISDHIQLYSVESTLSFIVADCGRFMLDALMGLQYVNLELEEEICYDLANFVQPGQTPLKYHSQLWGIGPEFGGVFSLSLLPYLELTGYCQAALLASKREASIHFLNTIEREYDVKDEPYWCTIPLTDLRVGLSYGLQMPCFGFSVEAGYEFLSYYKGVNRLLFIDVDSVGDSFNELMALHLHGLYLTIRLNF